MTDPSRTNQELLEENSFLKQRIQDLEQSEAQRKLQESEERFRELFNCMSSGVAMYEAIDNGEDFIFRDFNPAAENIEKVSRKDILGKRVSEAFSGVKAFGVFEVFQRVWQTGKMEYFPQNIYKDERDPGSWRESWVFKLPTGEIVSVYNDITERKQAEQALRESEEIYRVLFEGINDAVFMHELNEEGLPGRFLQVNDVACRRLGYTREELLSLTPIDITMPEEYERIADKRIGLASQGDILADTVHVTKDGLRITVESNIRKFQYLGKQVALSISRDITDRRQAEEALRESEERYRNLFENANEAIFVAQDGKLVFLNPMTTISTGYTSEELMAKPFIEFIHTDDRGMVIDRHIRRMKGEELPHRYPFRIIHRDGNVRWIELNAVLINWRGKTATLNFLSDISERKQAEEALQLHAEIERNMGEAVYLIRVDDAVIVYTNQSFDLMFGYDPGELIGRNVSIVNAPGDKNPEAVANEIISSIAQTGMWSGEVFNIRKDGTTFWCHANVITFEHPRHGKVWLSIHRDITARKQADEKLQDSETRFRQLADSTWEGIIIHREGIILDVNESILKMSGWQPEEVIGKSALEFLAPESIETALQKLKENIETPQIYFEGKGLKKDKTVFPIEVLGRPIKYNSLDARVIAIRDITERKQAEQALRESEEKYRAIIENMEEGYHEVDLKGNFTFFNESMRKIMGYEREELLGMNNRQYADEENTRKVYQVYNQVYQTGVPVRNFEWKIIRKDGDRRDIEVSISLIRDAEGHPTGFRDIVRDTTDRRQAELALRDSEEKYRNLVENVSDVIYEIDSQGVVIYISPAVRDVMVYDQADIVGKKFIEFVYEDDRSRLIERFIELSKGIESPLEYRLISKSGDIRWVRTKTNPIMEDGSFKGAHGTLIDITTRKQAEEALKQSESQYRLLADNMKDHVWLMDLNLKPTYISPSVEKSRGYTFEEIAQLPLDKHLTAASFQSAMEFFSIEMPKALADTTYRLKRSLELEFYRKDGSTLWVEAQFTFIRDENDKPLSILSVGRDITERKLAEEEKRSLEERLNRAEKMEALGTLAGGVAHDLNNVLGVVVGYAELVLMKADESSMIRPQLVNIMNGGLKAAAIVDDLLTLARRGISDRDVLNLNKIIADCQKSPEFEKLYSYHPSVKIKTDIDPDLPNISCSSVHLGKSLYNLISNASEAMAKGGVVTIKTRNQYLDKPIQGYDNIQEGDYVVLSVSDTGEGIQTTDLKRIFEPFYTKKVMGRSGTGLGLAVVWGTVKDHHGYINVESEEGKGSTFTLYFPVTREAITAEHIAIAISEYMGSGESILVVDDVKEQRDLASGMLRKLNYNVSSVSSGEEAIAYLKEHQADLVVLDMIMDPGMDGLDTYRSVLEIRPKQKAIIVSGFSESDRVRAARDLGAGAYVRKPYITEKLGLAVKNELDKNK